MTEAQWVLVFVHHMLKLRGKKAEPKAIEDFARSVYPVLKDLPPAKAAEQEASRQSPPSINGAEGAAR